MSLDTIGLVAVRVGMPAEIGIRRGKPVLSGFRKQPVDTATIRVSETNLAGDGQGDLSVHGGIFKAVYAYPSEHLSSWNEELGAQFGPNAFGENLTTIGPTEADARIGDIWTWGDARLQICQPRWPCYKLVMASGHTDIGKRMHANGRTGWYLRVVTPGDAPIAGPITVERDPAGVTVLDAHRALSEGASPAQINRVISHPALAPRWRESLTKRLAELSEG